MGILPGGAEFIPGQHRLMVIYRELNDCDDESEQHGYLQTIMPITADIDLVEKSLGEMERELQGNISSNSKHGFTIESIAILRDYLSTYRQFLEKRPGGEINPIIESAHHRLLNSLLPPVRTKK